MVFRSVICLALLSFSRSLALSILSMLSSAKEKRTPDDNAAREFVMSSSKYSTENAVRRCNHLLSRRTDTALELVQQWKMRLLARI